MFDISSPGAPKVLVDFISALNKLDRGSISSHSFKLDYKK